MLREVRKIDRRADIIYVADQGNAPYGPKTLDTVANLAANVTRWLSRQGAETIVVACNTASAAALHQLRALYPHLQFVGMEPAIKPAALSTETQKVAVFATRATFGGRLFAETTKRFASGLTVLEEACPEWVELVEIMDIDSPEALELVSTRLDPVVAHGADKLVLACTHFSFLAPLMRALSSADVIDPAPAVARQVARVTRPGGTGVTSYFTTGDARIFSEQLRQLLDIDAPVGEISL